MQKLNEEEARQGERRNVAAHVLIPSTILASIALVVVLVVYVF